VLKAENRHQKSITCHIYCHITAVDNLLLEIFALLGYLAAPRSYPETSVTNYQCMSCNIAEERRSHLHRCGSLKSHTLLLTTDINIAPHILVLWYLSCTSFSNITHRETYTALMHEIRLNHA
jgi:hypothetical protein